MRARFGRPHISLENFSTAAVSSFLLYDIPVLSTKSKMACSSSVVNDSVILTKDDIPGASLAGLNPFSLKNEELRFWLRDAM